MSWREVYRYLKSEIQTGALAPGAALPTQAHMAARHAVSRHAVRRAVEALQRDGLVASWQGKGAVVQARPIQQRLADWPQLGCAAAFQGDRISIEPIEGSLRRMPAEIAAHLRLSRAGRCLVGERIVKLDGQEAQIVRHYFDAARFAGILETLDRTESLREALEAHGVRDVRRVATRVLARRPTQHESVVLKIAASQPVMATTTRHVDPDGQPLHATETVARGDRMHLLI